MSQRTLVEINSDWLSQIERDPKEFVADLSRAIARSRGDEDELRLRTGFGAKVIARRHHSEEAELRIGKRTMKWS